MVELEFRNKLTGDTVGTNVQKLLIVDEGRYEEIEVDGKTIRFFVLGVKLPNGEEYDWQPNKTSLGALSRSLGRETAKWINKDVDVKATSVNVKGAEKLAIFVV